MSTKAKRQRFFEVSLSGLKATNQEHSWPVLPATYVTLSSGVDNTKRELPRASTHADRSVQRRTAKRLFLKREIASAITHLVAEGLLVDLTPEGEKRKTGATTYQVSPDRVDDLVPVSHHFIGIKISADGNSRRYELHPGAANLAGMLDSCSSLAGQIDLEQAQTDALQAYFHLLSRQNFKAYGGVDPVAVSGTYRDCVPGENPVYETSFMPIADGRAAQVRFAVSPEELKVNPKFAQEVLAGIAVESAQKRASLTARLEHAIKQLEKADLLYRAAVLWNDDPRVRPGVAKPIATVAIRGSWLSNSEQDASEGPLQICELSVQKGIDKLLREWWMVSKRDQFTSSSESVFANTGIYRYVVPTSEIRRWVLLDQYRVRWWAVTDDNEASLGSDNRRSKDYLASMVHLVGPSMEN